MDQGGVVTLHSLDDDHTRVALQTALEPEGAAEQIGDEMGAVSSRVRGDLKRFKEFIEERGSETGAWRGEIDREDVT